VDIRIVGAAHKAMTPLFRYARTSRITPAFPIHFCRRPIRMSRLTWSKNFSRSTSSTIRRPDWTSACARTIASCALRPARKAKLRSAPMPGAQGKGGW